MFFICICLTDSSSFTSQFPDFTLFFRVQRKKKTVVASLNAVSQAAVIFEELRCVRSDSIRRLCRLRQRPPQNDNQLLFSSHVKNQTCSCPAVQSKPSDPRVDIRPVRRGRAEWEDKREREREKRPRYRRGGKPKWSRRSWTHMKSLFYM